MFMLLFPVVMQQDPLPEVQREFRAAWVATVDNIDWPSKRTLSTEVQKDEMIRILDRAVTLNLNAIIFQVRPAADAMYASKFEPWSEYLTNKQGKRPNPSYDPLEFAVTEAHKRGLELHCWFNPYRAKHPTAKGQLAPSHIAKKNPGVVKQYGKLLWMDPGEPLVQKRTLNVVEDVVRRYDIDGVHIDDYFYPYPEKGIEFPDASSYAKYGKGLSKSDWRRKNVDDLVSNLYTGIHKIKPWVKFGISPFGVYRPGIPQGIRSGVDQYAELYADPLKWLQHGWCDYLTPQLYWAINQKPQSYPVLLNWWISQNAMGRHIWPGLFTSRIIPGEAKPMYTTQEVVNQVLLTRQTQGATGHVHFSMKALSLNAGGVADALRGEAYSQDAIPPETTWLSAPPADAPIKAEAGEGSYAWEHSEKHPAFWYVVWLKYGETWTTRVLPGGYSNITPPKSLAIGDLKEVRVAAVNRLGKMSSIVPLR